MTGAAGPAVPSTRLGPEPVLVTGRVVQGIGGGTTIMVVDDLSELIRQFASERDLVGLPFAR